MWGAIKADLMTFVTTVTEDTSKTINKVLGDEELEEEEDPSIQEKMIADLRRSYETYATPIKEKNMREYDRFKKKFDLSSSAAEIAIVLDQESEVSRFYAELVPISISPEEFWGRLFFRMSLVYRHATGLDDEDDEELVWEEEEEEVPEKAVYNDDHNSQHTTTADTTATANTCTTHHTQCNHSSQTNTIHTSNEGTNTTIPINDHMNERVLTLEEENRRLQEQEESLKLRIAQLEALLAAQSNVAKSSSMGTSTPPSKSKTHSETAENETVTATPHSPVDTAKSASIKKKKATTGSASTAKKLFDSPATATAIVKADIDHKNTTLPMNTAEKKQQTASTTPQHTTADHASQSSSEESAIVVNRSDVVEEDLLPLPPSAPPSAAPKTSTSPNKSTAAPTTNATTTAETLGTAEKGLLLSSEHSISFRSNQETAKYLASLDDQDDDEEDGWN